MTITTEAAQVYRDRQDGVRWNPKKDEIRALFESVDEAGRFALNYDDAERRTVAARFQEMPVSVSEFENLVVPGVGGLPDDWTAAFNAAFATNRPVYMPTGGYRLTSEVTMGTLANHLVGDGVTDSYFIIDADDFDMDAPYVLGVVANDQGAYIDGVGFQFSQPVSASRAEYHRYPWAISCNSCPRVRFGHVRVSGGWRGIDARGNTGGLEYDFLELGCLGEALAGGGTTVQIFDTNGSQSSFTVTDPDVDGRELYVSIRQSSGVITQVFEGSGSNQFIRTGRVLTFNTAPVTGREVVVNFSPALDFWHGGTAHFWPWGFTNEVQLGVYLDSLTVASRLGRIDGLDLQSVCTFGARFFIEDCAGQGPFGTIVSLELDGSHSRVDMANGRLAILGGYKTSSTAGDYAIRQGGGHAAFGAFWLAGPGTGLDALVLCSGGYQTFSGGHLVGGSPDAPIFQVTRGVQTVTGMQCLFGQNSARSVGFFSQVGPGVAVWKNNYFEAPGAGTGPAISVAADNVHDVSGNILSGWPMVSPLGDVVGTYGPNSGRKTIQIAASETITLTPGVRDYEIVNPSAAFIGNISGIPRGDVAVLTFLATVPVASETGSSIQLDGVTSHTFLAGDTLTLRGAGGPSVRELTRSIKTWTNPSVRSVASAGLLPILPSDSVVTVTGGTTIGQLPDTYPGHTVEMVFSSPLTILADSPNIKLRGSPSLVVPAGGVLSVTRSADGIWRHNYSDPDVATTIRSRTVASANLLPLIQSDHQTTVLVSGSTQINEIAGQVAGFEVQLIFTGSPLVKNNFPNVKLDGNVDFAATPNDTLRVASNGTLYVETARSVNT